MQDTVHYKHTNRLANETSPYLLQHAHNPVDWYPWGEEAFAKARAENKLVLVSIGYSSCHWCHVMERESFENDSVAALMNQKYVCIKVDREERPDVDQVYMSAVQLMTGRGGWPLNCFTLPDGRPAYGGTYFPPDQWKQLLQDLSETWRREPQRVTRYAEQLHDGVKGAELVHLNDDPPVFTQKELEKLVDTWEKDLDHTYGGPDRAPKFPMPNNLQFLLRQGTLTGNTRVARSRGTDAGQDGHGRHLRPGGWRFRALQHRRAVEGPHFEKMLYDNAQLISLYSQGWQAFKKPLYKEVVEQTIGWIDREMTSEEGAFYSALDADSEGEEGKFYVWTKEELQRTLGADYPKAELAYDVNAKGLWEHDRYILLRESAEPDAQRDAMNKVLLAERSKRVRPGLDDKSLTSWNAMMVTGCAMRTRPSVTGNGSIARRGTWSCCCPRAGATMVGFGTVTRRARPRSTATWTTTPSPSRRCWPYTRTPSTSVGSMKRVH
jgi:uncharacterized protein YyaL (SSP411 family)